MAVNINMYWCIKNVTSFIIFFSTLTTTSYPESIWTSVRNLMLVGGIRRSHTNPAPPKLSSSWSPQQLFIMRELKMTCKLILQWEGENRRRVMEEVRYHQKHLSSSQLHTLSKQTEITEAQDHELMHTECCFSCPSLIHKPHIIAVNHC